MNEHRIGRNKSSKISCPDNPQYLLSRCSSEVWQWDINGHQAGPTYIGSYIAFSSDGTQLVSYQGKTVTVRDSNSGVIVVEFNITNFIQLYCFSPDGRLITVTSETTVYIWDITNPDPCLIETLTGHTKSITSLVFSSPSSLTSASHDKSVRELPPPTPREAYLSQRPECMHKRGNDGDTEQAQ